MHLDIWYIKYILPVHAAGTVSPQHLSTAPTSSTFRSDPLPRDAVLLLCRYVATLYKYQLWVYDGLPRLRRQPGELLVRLDLLTRPRLVRFHPRPALRGGKFKLEVKT